MISAVAWLLPQTMMSACIVELPQTMMSPQRISLPQTIMFPQTMIWDDGPSVTEMEKPVVEPLCSGRNESSSSRSDKFRLPAPVVSNPASGWKSAEPCSANFTCNGVKSDCPSSTNATAPDTTAAAMLVPLIAT